MIQVGRLHAAQGNSEVAVAALRQAVTLQPGKAAFWSILGVELAKAGTWAQAQHCLVRSLQLETTATAWTSATPVAVSFYFVKVECFGWQSASPKPPPLGVLVFLVGAI